MSSSDFGGSVSHLIEQLKKGESSAAAAVWNRYFDQLVNVARKRLGTAPRRQADEEDVALEVMNSLIAGAANGRFPKVSDRDDLWKLLLVITRQKAVDQIRHQMRNKRGGGEVRGDSIFFGSGSGGGPVSWDVFLGNDPTPEALAALNDQYRQLMAALPDDTLRRVTELKLQSYTDEEVAERMEVSVATVQRKKRRIREIWIQISEESELRGE